MGHQNCYRTVLLRSLPSIRSETLGWHWSSSWLGWPLVNCCDMQVQMIQMIQMTLDWHWPSHLEHLSLLEKILNVWSAIWPCWHISPWRVLLRESSIVSWTWSPALTHPGGFIPLLPSKRWNRGSLQIFRLQIQFPESPRPGYINLNFPGLCSKWDWHWKKIFTSMASWRIQLPTASANSLVLLYRPLWRWCRSTRSAIRSAIKGSSWSLA